MPAVDEVRGIVAAPERLRAWVEVAKHGDRFVYATRYRLPANSPGAAFARLLQSHELVNLFQPRSVLNPSEFNYLAVRTGLPLGDAFAAKPARRRLIVARTIPDCDEAAAIDQVLPILQRAAQFGRPCPTNAQLAERAGIAVDRVQSIIDAMRAANLIRVHAAAAPTLRRVLVVATGLQTGLIA